MAGNTFKPREEIIVFFEESSRRGSAATGHINRHTPKWVKEMRAGTELGRELYNNIKTVYDDMHKK